MKSYCWILLICTFIFAQEEISFDEDMSLEDLVNVTIVTASGVEEKKIDAPASMVIITANDIKQRGYSSLDEVMLDLPGFDISVTNGTHYLNAYQRGYRTTWTQRTLFLINNKVDNHLWLHSAEISRQYPMSMIKKIEVLYGPASAVYGANAFLGIINIVTYDGGEQAKGESESDINLHLGSFNTKSLDFSIRGRSDKTNYHLGFKLFNSDEEDLSKKWGFLSNDLFSSKSIWGPLLKESHEGEKLDHYYDPTKDFGLFGSITHNDFKFEFINWKRQEGYGAMYTADHAQNNSFWNYTSKQYFLEYNKELNADLKLESLIGYRESDVDEGLWVEATPDWNPGKEDSSYVSLTYWNSLNSSTFMKHNLHWGLDEVNFLSFGIKYEHKNLTKAYDIPGYWDGVYTSTSLAGSAVTHTREEEYTKPKKPKSSMPDENAISTEDFGGFVQYRYTKEAFLINSGLRYDYNSIYGSSFNPRFTFTYRPNETSAIKLIYGEAFQEPPPLQLWGGWQGRKPSPHLKPEKVRNHEIAFVHFDNSSIASKHELSMYYATYDNVIKEEAENAGERDVYGAEYKLQLELENPMYVAKNISGSFYVTYTKTISEISFDHTLGQWIKRWSELGDIANWKYHYAINLPLNNKLNINLRGHYIGERKLYLRNPLRNQNETADPYFLLNLNLGYKITHSMLFSFKVKNALDNDYFHPGTEHADSGNDFSSRSKGFRNSLVPQESRSFMFSIKYTY